MTDKPFNRLISLVPSQTELLCELGLASKLVGVTKFCVHPSYIKKQSVQVGGTKQVKWEKIRALQPDIVLCNKEENTREIVEQLARFTQVHVADINNLDDCFELMMQYGQLFKVLPKATQLIETIDKRTLDYRYKIQGKPRPKVAYMIWKSPWMLAGGDTFINHLLELAGFENAFKGLSRYPEVTLEALQAADLNALFLSSEPYPFKEKHLKELKEWFPNTPLMLVDGEYFSWYGSRLLGAFGYFEQLYAEFNP